MKTELTFVYYLSQKKVKINNNPIPYTDSKIPGYYNAIQLLWKVHVKKELRNIWVYKNMYWFQN